MKVFLVRHGESESDIEDRYGGDYDDHLTAKGKKQAEKAAKQLKNKNIKIIFSSPKFRAKETAEILNNELKCRIEVVNDLRERNRYGILTGMKKSEAIKKHQELVKLLKDEKNNIEGGETYNHFVERVISAFKKLEKEKYSCIAIVSHGGPIKCIMREIIKKPIERALKDCAIIEIFYNQMPL